MCSVAKQELIRVVGVQFLLVLNHILQAWLTFSLQFLQGLELIQPVPSLIINHIVRLLSGQSFQVNSLSYQIGHLGT